MDSLVWGILVCYGDEASEIIGYYLMILSVQAVLCVASDRVTCFLVGGLKLNSILRFITNYFLK